MKFSCEKCSSRYAIKDEKIPLGKTVRFTCKKCAHVIRLQRSDVAQVPTGATQDPAMTAVVSARPADLALSHADPHVRLKQQQSEQQSQQETIVAGIRAAPKGGWFVMVSGKQQGPLSVEQIFVLADQQQVDARVYTWRVGMKDWVRLGELPEFSARVQGLTDAIWRQTVTPKAQNAQTVSAQALSSQTPSSQESSVHSDEGGATVVAPNSAVQELRKQAALLASQQAEAEQQKNESLRVAPVRAATMELTDLDLGEALTASLQEQTSDQLVDMTEEIPDPEALEGDESVSSEALLDMFDEPGDSANPFGEQPEFHTDEYFEAPPGESTQIFMETAGIYQRRRRNKTAAIIAVVSTVVLTTIVTLDITGYIEIPGMGLMYDISGVADPNLERATERVATRLSHSTLSNEERAALRAKLLGLNNKRSSRSKKRMGSKRAPGHSQPKGVAQQGIKASDAKKQLTGTQRKMANSLFNDDMKSEKKLNLSPPDEIQTPNLPAGLDQASIFKVISDNTRSMSLCITQSIKAGEKLTGKMDVEITIDATGKVIDAQIATPRFVKSVIGGCTKKTVKRWKFPRFNGEPLTVIFPYVLQAGF